MIGEVIGSYRLVAELGKGGMGMVYRAEHVQLGRPAALKMLQPRLSSDGGIVQRFFNEAKAASAIDHPGIVEIYDFGTHTDGRAYIVMALLRGESLEDRLKRGQLAPLDGATLLAQVAGALAAAHARGIVHRDLKPDNIYLVPNEMIPGGIQVKLLDFGIAKLADEQAAGFKTQTGALMGTPAYMSPEQCMGRSDLDHRTDLYSLGCILYHVMCGRPPFTSDQGTGVMIAAHLRDPVPDPRTFNPSLPPALIAVVMRLLEKEPQARFQTAAEVRSALVAAGANAPPTKAPEAFAETMHAPSVAPPGSKIRSPEAMLATTAREGGSASPTTNSGSAAEMIRQAPAKPVAAWPKWVAVGAAVLVLGGGGAFFALRDREPPAPAVAASPPPVAALPPAAAPAPPAPAQLAEPACPEGQSRRDDTSGHCCWPDQAWSTEKAHCVGAPTCPHGMAAHGETCVAAQPAHTAPELVEGSVAFHLSDKTYAPGAPIKIAFQSPMSSKTGHQAWIAVAETGSAPSSYGVWKYIDDRATAVTLEAPKQAGSYEVRLHTDYPAKPYNLRYSVPFEVGAPQQIAAPTVTADPKFSLRSSSVHGGDKIDIAFASAMVAAQGEQYWITIIDKAQADSAWGSYAYVPAGGHSVQLTAPSKAGDYEIRLHGNYPTKPYNVVFRRPIRVE